jgi:hypothetical protein
MNTPVASQKSLVIVGGTGMAGDYTVRYALDHPAVGHVMAIGRRKVGISHSKLTEILLASVVEHKKAFFREAAARYDLAKLGSLRVCPPDSHVAQMRSDSGHKRDVLRGGSAVRSRDG